jgi:hypothetical protein
MSSLSFDWIKNKEFISKPQTFSFHNLGDIPEYGNIYPAKTEIKGTWDFCSCDSQGRLKEILKYQPSNWYYRHNKVKYTLNSEGYRTKEFDEIDWENSIVMFGCSHVFGTGNDDSSTIPVLLENMLGIPVINMGINAASIKTISHNSLSLYNSYKTPKMVIFGWTSLSRKGLYSTHNVETTGHIFNSQEEVEDAVLTNFLLVNLTKTLWENKCPLYEFSFFKNTAQLLKCDYYKNVDLARDDVHYGIKSHHIISKKIYNKIKDNLK